MVSADRDNCFFVFFFVIVYVDPDSWNTIQFKKVTLSSGKKGNTFDLQDNSFTPPVSGVWHLTLRLRMTGNKGEKTCFALATYNLWTRKRTKIAEDCVACEKVYSKMLSTLVYLAKGQTVEPVFFGTISSQYVEGDQDLGDLRDTEFFGYLVAEI